MREHMYCLSQHAGGCEHVVEIGVYDCTSTWALLAGHPKRMTSYDIDRRVEVDDVEKAAAGSTTNFQFIKASSLDVTIDETDLLFIDSFHSYPQLKRELARHGSKATKYIILHDTTTFGEVDQITFAEHPTDDRATPPGNPRGPGLWPAIEEFIVNNPGWRLKRRYTNCHGLTILEKL